MCLWLVVERQLVPWKIFYRVSDYSLFDAVKYCLRLNHITTIRISYFNSLFLSHYRTYSLLSSISQWILPRIFYAYRQICKYVSDYLFFMVMFETTQSSIKKFTFTSNDNQQRRSSFSKEKQKHVWQTWSYFNTFSLPLTSIWTHCIVLILVFTYSCYYCRMNLTYTNKS
jgi:hypothetical protein